MSEQQLKAFLEKLQGDSAMQSKLKAAANSDAVMAIAEQAGFVISVDTLKQPQSELSEEELEGVTGGVLTIAAVVWGGLAVATKGEVLGVPWCKA